jgi:hypothetical protein
MYTHVSKCKNDKIKEQEILDEKIGNFLPQQPSYFST